MRQHLGSTRTSPHVVLSNEETAVMLVEQACKTLPAKHHVGEPVNPPHSGLHWTQHLWLEPAGITARAIFEPAEYPSLHTSNSSAALRNIYCI